MAVTDDIKARLDLVDVVTSYVPELKRAGKNYHARCPFHQENTPSFVVFPERQSWRCFGACATGGDVFSFVMKAESTDFPGALKRLAERAGVQLPERAQAPERENPIYEVNEAALRVFRDGLSADQGALARGYAEERGLTEEAQVRWGIGYAPSTGHELIRRLEAMGYARELILAAGLATRNDSGEDRDMLRGRLTFTLRDADGRLAGFAGRSLDGGNPKYLNTPQTQVFDKGRILYGMDRARDAMAREGVGVVVEGYLDVITAHEHGHANVVASMGTALTEHQIAQLRARAQRIVLALDADAAGQEAMRRSLWEVAEQIGRSAEAAEPGARSGGLPEMARWSVATLREGKDPDEIIRNDPARWRGLLAEAVPILDFLMEAERSRGALTTEDGNVATVERFWQIITGITDWAAQDRYVQRLADVLGVQRTTLEAAMGRQAGRRRPAARRTGVSAQRGPQQPASDAAQVFRDVRRDALEEHLLALVVHYPELRERATLVEPEHLHSADTRALLSALVATDTMEDVYERLDGHLAERLEHLQARELPPADRKARDADWAECVRRLEERHLRELKAQEEGTLDGARTGTGEQDEAAGSQALAINQRLRELFVSGSDRT